MSWWRDLCAYGLETLSDLDQLIEEGGEAVLNTIAPLARQLDQALDQALDGARDVVVDDLGAQISRAAQHLDEGYQHFMVRRIDPLFGQSRTSHLEEMGGVEISAEERSLNRRIALTAVSLAAILVGRALFPASLALFVPASFSLVLPVFGMARRSVAEQRRITYHVVGAINVTAIWLSGRYVPALVGTFFFYMGEKLLMITEDRSHNGLISIFSEQPSSLFVVRDGVEIECPFEDVGAGDVISVSAGGHVPVDGTIVEGMASIDQQMLTGEAQPAEKGPGELVFASTVVLAGAIHVRVDKAGSETVAAKIGEVLNRTASYQLALKSKGSKLAHDSAAPTLLLSGLALAARGPEGAIGILNSSFGASIRLSAPVLMLNLLNIASRNGILLKDGRSLELLAEVDTVVFDKTGTLTLSRFQVAQVHAHASFDETSLLTVAAAAEHRQSHPIAVAILAAAAERGLDLPPVESARYEVGYGIDVEIRGQRVQVGSDRYLANEAIDLPQAFVALRERSHARGHSLVMVAVDRAFAGAIELQPTIRPEAREVLTALRARDLKMVIISGDQEEPTRQLAEDLHMDGYFANVLPEGKAALIEQLQAGGRAVCFVGDGINDSIALKQANVSVSLRGATTVATDAAQVVLMQESLARLPFLFDLADDMDRGLRLGTIAGIVPGVITTAGVFLRGWGYMEALALSVVSLAAGLGIAVRPLSKYRESLNPAAAAELRARREGDEDDRVDDEDVGRSPA